MGHLEPSAAAAGLASLVLVPLSTCLIAMNAQLRLSDAPWEAKRPNLEARRLNTHLSSIVST
jgi:hypothetical protein